ncbi:M23 family metallopeptidase [Lactobacillus agrestimuris]|uniref:M23 family metallopeptidase n=1 Tax=Lactobacillus agrestimuris TaxID=2941328 RepID=UPI0020431B81|nr:M23 family metallopeptidase [Lactobacillus agrestimuris]
MSKKHKKKTYLFFFTTILIIAIACFPMIHNPFDFVHGFEPTHKVKKKKVVKKKVAETWIYPFKKLDEKKINFKSGQKFGETDVIRRVKPKSYFHDGFDFGFSEVGHSPVFAIHDGVVHKVHFRPGMGLYIWVISPDGYVQVYQEGFLSITDIYVKKGEKVKMGQKIGRLTGSHIHLGLTKTDKNYIDKHGDPCKYWWKNNGTWIDPMKVITANRKAAGKFYQ